MAVERKKISNTPEIESISGNENLLLGVTGGNKRVSTQRFKEYVGASVTRLFSDRVSVTVTIIDGAATPEENAVIDIVYLTDLKRFVSRKNINGAISYFSEWNGREEYQSDALEVREDRFFMCISNKAQYAWVDGELSLIVPRFKNSTDAEVEELVKNKTWVSGVLYLTYEDEEEEEES